MSATAGNSAIGNPNTIAIRSAPNTDCRFRLPLRNRNPSTIAAHDTSASSSEGGEGRIRRKNAIATRKVATSKTKAPLGWIKAISTPASTGAVIRIAEPSPLSTALTDANSSGSTRRAGHVSSAGRLNVYIAADTNANTYSGHSIGSGRKAFTAISALIAARIGERDRDEAAPLRGVGDGPPDDRRHEHRHQLNEPEHPHRQRRVRELEDLVRHDHRHDLVAHVRDRPPDEQRPELRRDPQRRQVHQVPAGTREQPGLRRVVGSSGGRCSSIAAVHANGSSSTTMQPAVPAIAQVSLVATSASIPGTTEPGGSASGGSSSAVSLSPEANGAPTSSPSGTCRCPTRRPHPCSPK